MVTPQQLDSENCSVEGCPAEGRRRYHVKGQPTLCDEHFAAKARANANGSGSNEQRLGLVEQVPKLERLARRLERARRKAEPAVRELKATQSGTRPSRCSSVAPIAPGVFDPSHAHLHMASQPEGSGCLLCKHLADRKRGGRARRRRVQHVQHAVGFLEQEVLDQFPVRAHALGPDARGAEPQVA
jgi:hypothetical protein